MKKKLKDENVENLVMLWLSDREVKNMKFIVKLGSTKFNSTFWCGYTTDPEPENELTENFYESRKNHAQEAAD